MMMRLYARTRERERAWKLGAIALGGAIFAAPFVAVINQKPKGNIVFEVSSSIVPLRVVAVFCWALLKGHNIGLMDILHHSGISLHFAAVDSATTNYCSHRH